MIFVGMIGSSFWALASLNVAMVTVLKNLTNIMTAGGDYFFYGRIYSMGVWAAMGLMIISALCGGFTDLTFNLMGYIWQFVNCACTAAYSLYLRGAMDRVAQHTSTGKKLDELSMVGRRVG
jgi:GDP-mannose transporter